jgi:chemosensory pili system protein ChpC
MSKAGQEQDRRELFGHLLPLQGVSLLLPKQAVVEIQGVDSVALEAGGPNWLLGFAERRGRRLPVVSIEAMAGAPPPPRSRRSRLAVIHSLGSHLDGGLFLVAIQGYPHLTAINPAVLERLPDQARDAEVALCRVRLATTEALIPDLETIEARLSEALTGLDQTAEASTAWEPRPAS